jgi:uncharacterized Fe-S cluster protein YjdI
VDIKKEYTNGEVTGVWQPGICIHAGNCARELPEVFKPKEKPWINLDNSNTERIINQVKACPSGALSYYLNSENMEEKENTAEHTKIIVIPGGPAIVHGSLEITLPNGEVDLKPTRASLCRCGASKNKPYCDGSHKGLDWE